MQKGGEEAVKQMHNINENTKHQNSKGLQIKRREKSRRGTVHAFSKEGEK